MNVVSLIAVAIGALFHADPERIVQGIRRMRLAILALIVLTFIMDWVTPHAIAVPMVYVLPILLTSLTIGFEWSIAAAILVNVLTYIGYYVSPAGGANEAAYINRLIASVLVWGAVIIGWLLRNVREDIQTFYTRYK